MKKLVMLEREMHKFYPLEIYRIAEKIVVVKH